MQRTFKFEKKIQEMILLPNTVLNSLISGSPFCIIT